MSKKSKALVIENTYYSLLLYILFDPFWRNSDYIIINERISDRFIQRLRGIVNVVQEYDYFPRLRARYPIGSALLRKRFLKKLSHYDDVYGNIYELKINLSPEINWSQIDDGEFTYIQLAEEYRAKIPFESIRNSIVFKKIFDIDYNFDFKKVSFLLPENMKYRKVEKLYKVNYVDIKRKYDNLTDIEKSVILTLFGLDFDLSTRSNLILMQPLYADGIVNSLEEEVELYKYMLKVLKLKENECILKPHPASNADYQVLFPEAVIISNDFPSELLSLTGKHFEKVATLFSSGINAFTENADELYFFGGLSLNLPVEQNSYKIINGEMTNFIPRE